MRKYWRQHETLPLPPGSAAIDAGDDVHRCNNVDQRGVTRPQGDHCDIGAFESRRLRRSLSGTPQTATIKTAFALPLGLTVTAKEPSEPVNGGQVMFRAPSSGASTTFGPTAVATIAGGAVSMPATANGTGGSYAVVASAAGAEDASFSLTNKLEADTATTLTASPNPSVTGQQVTFTASVTSSGAPVMSGTVAFKDAGSDIGVGRNVQSLDGAWPRDVLRSVRSQPSATPSWPSTAARQIFTAPASLAKTLRPSTGPARRPRRLRHPRTRLPWGSRSPLPPWCRPRRRGLGCRPAR